MNPFKRKKDKFPKPSGPRAMKEIQSEYQQASAQAANAQYQVFVHGKSLNLINQRLLELNQEADVRQKLDASVKAEQEARKATEKTETNEGTN